MLWGVVLADDWVKDGMLSDLCKLVAIRSEVEMGG